MNAVAEPTSKVAVVGFASKKDENRAKAEWPFEVALIYLDACIVDDTYQRPEQTVFVKNMIENFDETLVGAISVNERKTKRLAILDGQQRFLAMQSRGKTSCYASVYRGMTLADEAGFFYRMNRDRKSMSPFYGLRARRVAGDPSALAIMEIVEGQGFMIGPTTNENEIIGAVRALEVAYHMATDVRDDSLTPTLVTIRESVFGRGSSLDAWLIQGIAKFWSLTPDDEVNTKVLNDVLSDYGPSNLLQIVRERQAQNRKRSQPQLVAEFLAQRYNTNKVGAAKLPLNRYR